HELYRAAFDGIKSLKNEAADLKFLVIVSNGRTKDSAYHRSDVVKLANEENVRIFTLGFLQSAKDSPELQSMRRLAEETGGFFAKANLSDKRLPIDIRARFLDAIEGETGISFEADRTGADQKFIIEAQLKSGETTTGTLLIPGSEAAKVRFRYAFLTLSNPFISGPILLLIIFAGGLFAWFRFKTTSTKNGINQIDETNPGSLDKQNTIPEPKTQGLEAEKELTEELAVRLEGASLEVIGQDSDTIHNIDKPALRIGRSENSDIRLADPTVHRNHAIVRVTDKGQFTIEDIAGETGNGVYLNDKKISQAELFHGDIIELGNVMLKFDHEVQEVSEIHTSREKIAV
ncbi:MAG: FHA domain-containing protein, partial [Methyloligellaceae bacterium]